VFGCVIYIVAAQTCGQKQNPFFIFICNELPIDMRGLNIGVIIIMIVAFAIAYYFWHVVCQVLKEFKSNHHGMGRAGAVIRRG